MFKFVHIVHFEFLPNIEQEIKEDVSYIPGSTLPFHLVCCGIGSDTSYDRFVDGSSPLKMIVSIPQLRDRTFNRLLAVETIVRKDFKYVWFCIFTLLVPFFYAFSHFFNWYYYLREHVLGLY